MEFTLTANMLAVALPFASKRDVRYYLNGVKIEQAAGTSLRAVATDGHAMIACRDEASAGRGVPDCIVPRDVVEWALKTKSAEIVVTIGDDGACEAVAGSARLGFRMVDGRFPLDWQAIIQLLADDTKAVDFLAIGLVARFDKALAKVGRGRNGAAVRFVGGGKGKAVRALVANLVDGIHVTGVVMPIRMDWNDGAEAMA